MIFYVLYKTRFLMISSNKPDDPQDIEVLFLIIFHFGKLRILRIHSKMCVDSCSPSSCSLQQFLTTTVAHPKVAWLTVASPTVNHPTDVQESHCLLPFKIIFIFNKTSGFTYIWTSYVYDPYVLFILTSNSLNKRNFHFNST